MRDTAKYKPAIGKNIIENLTLGMYDDPRFVYREYVQNAADQIDIAFRQGQFESKNDAFIYINIDKENSRVVIEDNATGIESQKVLPLLGNIAQSNKNRYADKGFRGIGRLGGLGYCNKLTFETSFEGETTKSTMVWDAKLLKKIINDNSIQIEAAELISIITDYIFEEEKKDTHYFRVIMEGVTNEKLLNCEFVRDYLSMVAPLPFASHFTHRTKIYEEARKKNIRLDEYNIQLNQEQLFKGYKNSIYRGSKVEEGDTIVDVNFFEEVFNDTLLYWGWYGISPNMHQIPDENIERGIRLRKSNIQIGLETRLDIYHKEKLGNRYFIGEIYAVNKELIPNARRDFFIENDECIELVNKVQDFFHTKLYTLYYDFSKKNEYVKNIQILESLNEKLDDKSLDKEEKAKLSTEVKNVEKKVAKTKKTLVKLKNKYKGQILGEIIEEIDIDCEEKDQEPKDEKQPDSSSNKQPKKLSAKEEAVLNKVYEIIRQTLIRQTAEELILKIEGEIR